MSFIGRRFENAGITYNTGNWGMKFGALAQIALNTHGNPVAVAKEFLTYLIGNRASIEATVGSIAFFYGGRKYDQAWDNGFPPNQKKNDQGHLWSAVGAGFLAKSLVSLSKTNFSLVSAIAGGVLHVGGKLGSYANPRHDAVYKWLPLASRLPAVASLVEDIHHNFASYTPSHAALQSVLPISLVVCNFCFARADIMLAPQGRAQRVLSRAFLVPVPQG